MIFWKQREHVRLKLKSNSTNQTNPMKSKFFYEQHGEEIQKEVKEYKAHEERASVGQNRCPHKKATIQGGKLICPCGALWFGAGLERLVEHFRN